MINYISTWAEQIIIALIVITVLEMILPNGNTKKYIKTVMGVYILYIIISPFVKTLSKGDISINNDDYEKYFNEGKISSKLDTVGAEDIYKTQIEKQLKLDIEEMGYSVINVNAKLNLSEGKIENIKITISKENKEKDISINKIEIGNSKPKNSLDKAESEKIKQKTKENYGVDYDNIIINLVWSGG